MKGKKIDIKKIIVQRTIKKHEQLLCLKNKGNTFNTQKNISDKPIINMRDRDLRRVSMVKTQPPNTDGLNRFEKRTHIIPNNINIPENLISFNDIVHSFVENKSIKRSIIISYKESGIDRKNNLIRLLNYLSNLLDGETEIVLVEQDVKSKIDWLYQIKRNEYINHIFIKNEKIFNKGWGYNIGAKEAKGDFLVFNDCDLFIKLSTYNESFLKLVDFNVINPYNSLYFLDDISSINFINNSHVINYKNINVKPISPNVISGGIFFIRKDSYFKIKGFDENCYGWGSEDGIFDIKMKKMELSLSIINNVAIHLYHMGNNNQNSEYYINEKKNSKLYIEYAKMSKGEIKKLIENIESYGIKPKN